MSSLPGWVRIPVCPQSGVAVDLCVHCEQNLLIPDPDMVNPRVDQLLRWSKYSQPCKINRSHQIIRGHPTGRFVIDFGGSGRYLGWVCAECAYRLPREPAVAEEIRSIRRDRDRALRRNQPNR